MPFDQTGYEPAPAKSPAHPAPASSPVVRLLTEARAFLEAGWSRDHFSIDAFGNGSWSSEPTNLRKGVAFCAWGSIRRAGVDLKWPDVYAALQFADRCAQEEGHQSLIDLNGSGDQEQVVAFFNRAIAAAEAAS